MARFHHVGLTVADLDRSYAFYCDVVGMAPWDQDAELGLEPAPEHAAGMSGSGVNSVTTSSSAFRSLTDNPAAVIKFAMLQSEDGALILQLVEYLDGGGDVLDLDHRHIGSPHLSFFVDDVERAREVATRCQTAVVRSEIVQINPSMRTFYVDDPDGVPVELLQLRGDRDGGSSTTVDNRDEQ